MKVNMWLAGLACAALACASPIVITFSGTGSGSVGNTAFTNSVFTFTFDSNTAQLETCCDGQTLTTPAGIDGSFSIAGIGTGIFTDPAVGVYVAPGPKFEQIAVWDPLTTDILTLADPSFANDSFDSSFGPTKAAAVYTYGNTIQSSLGTITLDSASGVSVANFVTPGPKVSSVPEPSTLSLFATGLLLCFVGLFRQRKAAEANIS